MKAFKVVLLGLILIACNSKSNSFSQSDLTPEQIVEVFFNQYDSEGIDSALEYIFSTNKWIAGNKEGLNNLKSPLKDLVSQVGEYRGKELIAKKSIGENYILWSYMIKYDRQPVRFQFIFYKPSDKWQLQDFRYDDDLDTELIEAANAYRLMENLPGN